MKIYTDKQIEAIEKAAFNIGYTQALTGDASGLTNSNQGILAMGSSLDIIPKGDISIIIKKVIGMVYYYMLNITDQYIAKDIVKKQVEMALNSLSIKDKE